mmetsp:Transcript_8005/g.17301  ORF Transcript_8005/g.17301 Transcript_8005/m.17301 type:complete len:151 (+) Transcript_8005:89-541(+)
MGQSCCVSSEDRNQEVSGRPDKSGPTVPLQDLFAESNIDPFKPPHQQHEELCEVHGKTLEVVVRKFSPAERLGMDVKHVRGRLIVAAIFVGGAVDRANQLSRVNGGDVLEVGDVVVGVNDKKDVDTEMVAECQSRSELRVRAVRRFQPVL